MGERVVVGGAILTCTSGSAPAVLVATMARSFPLQIQGKMVATLFDHLPLANVTPFGVCAITSLPCVPVTLSPWQPNLDDVNLLEMVVLGDGACLTCALGGKITVASAGQTKVELGRGLLGGLVNRNSSAKPAGVSGNLRLSGTPAQQQQMMALVNQIRNSGPEGAALISALENASMPTELYIGTSVTKANGTTTSLSNTGGGLTLRPTESVSGNNEVHIDPTHLIDYQADDGTSVTETPAGLLLHELGHASLLNSGDSAQTMGGPQAEANVRTLTNPIRTELGMKPER